MTRVTRCAAAIVVGVFGSFGFVGVTYGDAPVRVGWWNSVSAGGNAAPSPTTPAGGMHIASGPSAPLAYGALLYPVPQAASGQLELSITGAQGTVALVACPTKSANWAAGDDQASDTGPVYDCGTFHFPGSVSSDGTSVTFSVNALIEPTPGMLSLAIVPDPSASAPFSVDIDKPGPQSLSVTSPPPPTTTVPPTTTGPAYGQAPAAAPAAGAPLGLPRTTQTAPQTTTVAPPGSAPQVASNQPANAAPVPTASTRNSARATEGSIFGALALVAALLFWGLGRGLLGGRITPLSVTVNRS
jgi:hypothetical protein